MQEGRRLRQEFYHLRATEMAPKLLGKILCRCMEEEEMRVRITEVEVYFGEGDTACHAHKGKTKRTKTLYEEGGVAYVYLCYGIHNLFNVVSGPEGFPEACLIRGVEGYDGPGKLTKAMKIDRSFNGKDLQGSQKLWLEEDGCKPEFLRSPRIGIGYASREDKDRLWRYYVNPKIPLDNLR